MDNELEAFWRRCQTVPAKKMVFEVGDEIDRLDRIGARLPRRLHRYDRQLRGLAALLMTKDKPTYLSLDELDELKVFVQRAVDEGASSLNIDELFS